MTGIENIIPHVRSSTTDSVTRVIPQNMWTYDQASVKYDGTGDPLQTYDGVSAVRYLPGGIHLNQKNDKPSVRI